MCKGTYDRVQDDEIIECKEKQMRPADCHFSNKDHFKIYLALLRNCISMKEIARSKKIHADILNSTLNANLMLNNTILNAYIQSGDIDKAGQMFDKMGKRNAHTWTIILSGYVWQGQGVNVLKLFHEMELQDVRANKVTLVSIASSILILAKAKWFHSHVIKSGHAFDVFVGTSLLGMYINCGSVNNARNIFDLMTTQDLVTWTTIIAGYAQEEDGKEALFLFKMMQLEGLKPSDITFVSAITACICILDLEQGKWLHAIILNTHPNWNVFVGNALIDMYAKCGRIEEAHQVFNQMGTWDVFSWTTLIVCYAQNGQGGLAIELYNLMQKNNLKPNIVTFVGIVSACIDITFLAYGKNIHAVIVKRRLDADTTLGGALVSMYIKCGTLEEARKVFNIIEIQDVLTCTTMINGYVQHGNSIGALGLFKKMQEEGIKPNKVTFVSVLSACTSILALSYGERIHNQLLKDGHELDVVIANSLIDMYAKCGTVGAARQVFNEIFKPDLISWNSMIAGYARHGDGKEALRLFMKMRNEGMNPDGATFISVLTACSHAKLVQQGCCYFKLMSHDYGISPSVDHYACMIDVLGRAGRLQETQALIKMLPFQPNAVIWMTLLSACRVHHSVELAESVAANVLDIEPQNVAAFVLLSNIYAAAGRWLDKAKVRKEMVIRGLKKEPGCAWIEVNDILHVFTADDVNHPQINKIHKELNRLSEKMEELGYVQDTHFMLMRKKKSSSLCHHSERLAIAFGLISTSYGTMIRIFKNLRVCGDCHTATKFISKICGREFLIRDAHRFHHFKDGKCSCGDFW